MGTKFCQKLKRAYLAVFFVLSKVCLPIASEVMVVLCERRVLELEQPLDAILGRLVAAIKLCLNYASS